MTLILQGTTLNEEPISQPLIGRFDERGGTLGRSDDSTLTLPDPERMISRLQAQVLYGDKRYWIENVSAASPILHNGRALSNGMRVVLSAGDELRIGGYALQVEFESDETNATILAGRTVVPGLRKVSVPAQMPPVMRTPPPVPTPAPPIAAVSIAAVPTPPAPFLAAASQAPATPAQLAATLAEPLSKLPPPGAARNTGGAEALWQAFVEGAGIDLPMQAGPSPKLMRSLGEMMKIAVAGIQSLVSMRATAKSEIQADLTMMQVSDNNPLKFAPDPGLALQLLLKPPARGFLDGPAALQGALGDLQSHQIGMAAGMRAVLDAVLERLDPQKIEALPVKRSGLDRLSRAHRQASLWNCYLEQYQSLREESLDNFQHFFGEAFREAYEAQVRNLGVATEDMTQTRDPPPRPRRGPG